MYDPFENQQKQNDFTYPNEGYDNRFPDLSSQWMPPIDEDMRSKVGRSIEKGTDILKKSAGFYLYAILLIGLLILFPPIMRFWQELSSWAFDLIGNIFH